MKQVPILFMSFLSATAFAATSHTLHAAKETHVKKAPVSYSKRVAGQMSCKLYTLDLTDDNAQAQLVATGNSEIIDVGSNYSMTVKYPAPYDKILVQFQQSSVSFYETGYDNFKPYLSSEFWDESGNLQPQSVSFDIDKARTGSNIMLRGAANADDNTNIYYQCALTFLK